MAITVRPPAGSGGGGTPISGINDVPGLQDALTALGVDIGTAQSTADSAVTSISTTVVHMKAYDDVTDTWEARPTLAAPGHVIANSVNDVGAAAPTDGDGPDIWVAHEAATP